MPFTGYILVDRQRLSYTGSVATVTLPTGATHYEARVIGSGGGGAGCPNTNSSVSGFLAVGGGGGSPGECRNDLRPIVTPLTAYVGQGGVGGAAGANNGAFGQDSYIKESGTDILICRGAQGGFASANFDKDTGGCNEGGAGGNHTYNGAPMGDLVIPGESGTTGFAFENVRVMGGGGSNVNISGGGKSSVSAGAGHGPSGGALSYNATGAAAGANGINGYIELSFYAEVAGVTTIVLA
jgi:hypothetical protein